MAIPVANMSEVKYAVSLSDEDWNTIILGLKDLNDYLDASLRRSFAEKEAIKETNSRLVADINKQMGWN